MSFFKLCHFRMIVDTEEAFFMQNVVDMSNSKNKSFCNKCLGVVCTEKIISIELFWLDNNYGILDQYHLFLAAFKPLKEGIYRLCKKEITK